jgi:hypothetical protein
VCEEGKKKKGTSQFTTSTKESMKINRFNTFDNRVSNNFHESGVVADANIGWLIHHLLHDNIFINGTAAGISLISSLASSLKRTITCHMKFIMVSRHALEKKRKRRSVVETAIP